MLAESKHQYLCADALASATQSIALSVHKKYGLFISSRILGWGLLTLERASSHGEPGLWIPVVLCNLRDKRSTPGPTAPGVEKNWFELSTRRQEFGKISCLAAEEVNLCFTAVPLRFFPLSRLLACSYNFQMSADCPPCRRLT